MEIEYVHRGTRTTTSSFLYTNGYFISGNDKFRRKAISGSSITSTGIVNYLVNIVYDESCINDRIEFLTFISRFYFKPHIKLLKYVKIVFLDTLVQNKIITILKIMDEFSDQLMNTEIITKIRTYIDNYVPPTNIIRVVYWDYGDNGTCIANIKPNSLGMLKRSFINEECTVNAQLFIIDKMMTAIKTVYDMLQVRTYITYLDIFYILDNMYTSITCDTYHNIYLSTHIILYELITCNPGYRIPNYMSVMVSLNDLYNKITNIKHIGKFPVAMECGICYDKTIDVKLMHPSKDTEKSIHFICTMCDDKYHSDSCPFCRRPIEFICRKLIM